MEARRAQDDEPATDHHEVLIVGGGNAGISLAARMLRHQKLDVAIIEPATEHYFQPLFSHIAAGAARMREAVRPQQSVMPRGARWIQSRVEDILPRQNTVVLSDGRYIRYSQLVVCPGIDLDFDSVPGLSSAMDGTHGSSDYDPLMVERTWQLIRGLRSGTAVFTQPPGPAKCSGAAQKIAYMACDYWREQGVLSNMIVVLVVPSPTVFGMPEVDAELERKIAEYGITLLTDTVLDEVDAAGRTLTVDGPTGRLTIGYDFLHAVPPQSAPAWLKATELPAVGNSGGFVEVNPETLRHPRFPNVWSLGDAAGSPNSKSGGALREQTKVVAKNLMAALIGKVPSARYDGYSVCPFTLERGTAFFAEFDAAYRPMKSFPVLRMAKERRWQWCVDRWIFPQVYWHLILKGRG